MIVPDDKNVKNATLVMESSVYDTKISAAADDISV